MTTKPAIASLFDHIPAILEEMPERFSSHQLILRLAQSQQQLYVEALSSYADGGEPFRAVHQQISAHMHSYDGLTDEGVVQSHDIFGNSNSCKAWRKN